MPLSHKSTYQKVRTIFQLMRNVECTFTRAHDTMGSQEKGGHTTLNYKLKLGEGGRILPLIS